MAPSAGARTLQLGMGWFPDQLGGLNRYFRDLLVALAAAGDEPTGVVIGPAGDAPGFVSVAADSRKPLAARLAAYVRAVRALSRPEVVDAHFALYALVPTRGPLRRLPLVVHFHGPWGAEGKASGQAALRSSMKRALERAVYRRANEAVVLSRSFRRTLVEDYRVQPWRISVIPPGVDLERFTPGDRDAARRELGLPLDAWIALTVRRLVPRMGIDTLLAAWAKVPREGNLLLVGGDGPERARLVEAAPAHVRFLGRIADEQLATHYRAADVVVVPSRALEGFGLVVLEAMACGTPVLVTDVGGLPEAVGSFPDLVVPAGDEAALTKRLAGAADGTHPLPSRTALRAHAEQFTWQRAVERHRAVYRRALGDHGRRPLRVVYLDHTAALSGGELALLRLLPALSGVDAHVILAQDGPLVERLEQAGVSVEILPLSESARGVRRGELARSVTLAVGAAASALYALRLAARLRQLRPDIVHTNSLKSALYGGVAGRLAGVPVVWHVRDLVADDALGSRGTGLVRAAAKRLPSAVIANSRSTLDSLGRNGSVIPSPVPAQAVPSLGTERPFTVGIVGRIARWKGQHVFLEAFAEAFPEGPEEALVIGAPLFGGDDDLYERELRDLALRLGLNGRVTFTGFVEDVPRKLGELDALVHASVLPEPFGQVVVEGLAAGIPVVASRAGGPAEVIEDGASGFLVSPGDVHGLAAVLRRLAADPGLRETVGARGRALAGRFAPEVVATETLDVYRRVLEG